MLKSKVIYQNKLPNFKPNHQNYFLFYDKALLAKSSVLKNWIQKFKLSYGIRAGEKEKSIEAFAKHISQVNQMLKNQSPRNLTFVVLGGGSIGDLGGFIASIYKRGVSLIHIPTTWLAAIDSSHGGKTGLNVSGIKNQLGTFYPAEQIYLVKEVLTSLPDIRAYEASGEIYKMGLLMGGGLWHSLKKTVSIDNKTYWKYLPAAVAGKYKIVLRDPYEMKGHRHLLNLGHTMGHVFEVIYNLPHGLAVLLGLRFCIEWSRNKKLMSEKTYNDLLKIKGLNSFPKSYVNYLIKSESSYLHYLGADKKRVSSKAIRFIFLRSPGKPIIQNVGVEEIVKELRRQRKMFHESL